MPAGRPPRTTAGITARQWATALGDTSKAGILRAHRSLSGARAVTADELARVADATGADLAHLTRTLATLRGYLAADASAGDPSDPAPS